MQEDIRALALAIGQQTEPFWILAEMNRKLIELLTPAQKDNSGQSMGRPWRGWPMRSNARTGGWRS